MQRTPAFSLIALLCLCGLAAVPTSALAQSAPSGGATLGLVAEACTTAGGEIAPAGALSPIYLAAAGGNDLYLYNRLQREGLHYIERWTVDSGGGGCTLTRDEGFAGDGQLERPGIVNSLAVVGDLLLVGDSGHTVFSRSGEPAYTCDGMGWASRIHGVPGTNQALVSQGSSGMERWTFAPGACTKEPLFPLPADTQVSYYWDVLQGDTAGLLLEPEQGRSIVRFGPDGREVWRFGSSAPDADPRLGNVMAVAAVGDRLLVADAGRTSLQLLAADGAWLATLDYSSILRALGGFPNVSQLVGLDSGAALFLIDYTDAENVSHTAFVRVDIGSP